MYRQSSLRLPCVVCGAEHPIARMALAPHGGHWCWKCQMGAQVNEHRAGSKREAGARALQSRRRQLLPALAIAFASVVVLTAVVFGAIFYAAFASYR